MQQNQTPHTSSTTRVPKPDDLRLRRRMVINMTNDEIEAIRQASSPEPISVYVRSILRKELQSQTL
jgi:hypothetical protein